VKLSERTLALTAALADAIYHPAGDPPHIALIAGSGEIQIEKGGDAYFLTWVPNGAVDKCISLDIPQTQDPEVLAAWLEDMAKEYEDQ